MQVILLKEFKGRNQVMAVDVCLSEAFLLFLRGNYICYLHVFVHPLIRTNKAGSMGPNKSVFSKIGVAFIFKG